MAINLLGPFNTGIGAGGAGVATNNATTSTILSGVVYGVYIKGNDSPPNTTDFTLATAGTCAPAVTILTITNYTADAWYYPRVLIHDTTGTASTTVYDHLAINDNVKATIAQANNGDSGDFYLLMDC